MSGHFERDFLANLEVAFGEGHGRFAPPAYYALDVDGLASGSGAIGFGHLRGIGRLDLVAGNSEAGHLRIPAKWMDDSDAMWIKSERSDANI